MPRVANSLRKPWVRRLLMALALIAALAGALLLFLWSRRPPDFAGPLDALLPESPVGVTGVVDLKGILEAIENSRVYREAQVNVDLAALLLTGEDWREFAQHKDSAAMRAKLALGRAFLKRCFGREALIAIAPSPARERPGFLAFTRADIGFLEQIGQLVAEYYPDLRLTKSRYRGVTVYQYTADKSRHSFAFILLGRVVALSLRTPDTIYLHEVIDRYRAHSLWPAAADSATPARSGAMLAGKPRGVYLDADPLETYRAIPLLFEGKVEHRYSPAQQQALEAHLAKGERLRADLQIGGELSLEARIKLTPAGLEEARVLCPEAATGAAPPAAAVAQSLPAETGLLVAFAHPDALAAGGVIWRYLAEWPAAPSDKEQASEPSQPREEPGRAETLSWDDALTAAADFMLQFVGVDPIGSLGRPFGRDLTLALIDAQRGLLFPMPRVELIGRASQPPPSGPAATAAAAGEASTSASVIQTLLGPFEQRIVGDSCRASLGIGTAKLCDDVRAGRHPSLAASANWRALGMDRAPDAPPALLVYANFLTLREAARMATLYALVLDKDARRSVIVTEKTIGALALLDAAALTAARASDTLILRLNCPFR